MNNKPSECIACKQPAIFKDYREHYQMIDGYPVCQKHLAMDDGNFWKAVNKKEREIKL